jgi:hypothetical protein
VNLSATFSRHLVELMNRDPDGAGMPASDDGPAPGTTQPERKGAHRRARGDG